KILALLSLCTSSQEVSNHAADNTGSNPPFFAQQEPDADDRAHLSRSTNLSAQRPPGSRVSGGNLPYDPALSEGVSTVAGHTGRSSLPVYRVPLVGGTGKRSAWAV